MKKSAIMQMFYGQRGHGDLVPCSQEYAHLLDIAVENDKRFKEKLKDHAELLELYIKSLDSFEMLYCELANNHYIEGFRFGALMGIDIMSDDTN